MSVKNRNKNRFRPELETLGERIVPAWYAWYGNTSDNWATLANWQVNGNVPTQLPGANDSVGFGATNNNCRIHSGISRTVQTLVGQSTYTGTLTLDDVLIVDGTGAMLAYSYWSSNIDFVNTVNGTATGALDIRATNFSWQGATIGSGNVVGEVCVDNDAILTILDAVSPCTLGANLFVGYSSAGTRSNEKVSLASLMNNNLTISNSVTIDIEANNNASGTMEFNIAAPGNGARGALSRPQIALQKSTTTDAWILRTPTDPRNTLSSKQR